MSSSICHWSESPVKNLRVLPAPSVCLIFFGLGLAGDGRCGVTLTLTFDDISLNVFLCFFPFPDVYQYGLRRRRGTTWHRNAGTSNIGALPDTFGRPHSGTETDLRPEDAIFQHQIIEGALYNYKYCCASYRKFGKRSSPARLSPSSWLSTWVLRTPANSSLQMLDFLLQYVLPLPSALDACRTTVYYGVLLYQQQASIRQVPFLCLAQQSDPKIVVQQQKRIIGPAKTGGFRLHDVACQLAIRMHLPEAL